MAFVITKDCIVCRSPYGCIYQCPVHAISFNGEQAVIDQDKCTECGKCRQSCYLDAIIDTSQDEQRVASHPLKKLDCDFLIIGAGAAGLTAALRASELTNASILLLEKGNKPGGCGAYAAGLRLFGTKWEEDAGIPNQMDDYIRAAINTTRGELDPQLISACFHAIPAFFNWFCQWGNAEEGFTLDRDGALNGMYVVARQHDNAGRYITTKMVQRCRELHIPCLTRTAATDFIMDQGRVVGVYAEDPGGKIKIRCKAVLIATGNLGNSKELHERCVPDYADAFQRKSQHLLPTCTGDGVTMAERAGLPVNLSSIVPAYLGPGCGGPYHEQLMLQPDRADALHVNLNGERFFNEQQRGEICSWAMLKQPKCVSYTIFDAKLLTSVPVTAPPLLYDPAMGRVLSDAVPDKDGKPKSLRSVVHLGFGRDLPADPNKYTPEVLNQIEDLLQWKGGYVFKAATLEELAEKIGVPITTFTQTVARYNSLCKKGHDDDYFKPSELMRPIEEGPFYAFHQYLPTDGTFGGLSVNSRMQLIDEDGCSVPGVYAAGDTTESRYINVGGEKRQIINDYSWAVSSGYIAGESVSFHLGDTARAGSYPNCKGG